MFHPFTQDDLPRIWACQRKLHTLSSEFDAFRMFVWLPLDQTEVCYWKDQFIFRCQSQGETWYIAPAETEDFHALLHALEAHERSLGSQTLRFLNVERELSVFPENYIATTRRDLFDYLYRAQDLIGMQGRAYAAKRNQIAQFKRKYDWLFEPLTPDNRADCLALVDQWDCTHEGVMLPYERLAVERMLSFGGAYGQSGGLLYADSQPVAFAIGSHPRAALLDIVAEKALPQYIGAYAMIIQRYAEYAYSLEPFEYVNREEDMGLENLRNAKLQLKPERLIEKTLMTAQL